jgi:diguanylate cyclase (GGDEF)-like protein
MLRNTGEVFFATDGASALRMARDKRPDLILLDIEMPDISGYDVCLQLKQDPELADSVVIFVTAHESPEHELRALEVGAADFIAKPLNPPIIQAKIKNHLMLKHQADTLRRQAGKDGMTGIYNRQAFDEMLETELRRHKRTDSSLGLAVIDVDFFQLYNESHGHSSGDDCLRKIAEIIVQSARRPAESVCRYGGEKFAVILPNTDEHQALQFANWLRQQIHGIALPHPLSSFGIVTLSVGVTSRIPSDITTPQTLIEHAEIALFNAKSQGKDRSCIYPNAENAL